MVIEKGNKVKVEYEGRFEDGTVFDSSETHGQPLEFEAGSGQVIKGFDEAVIGMEIGQEKEIKIDPSEGYGEHNPELIRKLPKDQFPEGIKEDLMIVLGSDDGRQFPAKIVEIGETEVSVDLNHPMAGKILIFKIKLVE